MIAYILLATPLAVLIGADIWLGIDLYNRLK